MKEKIQSPFFLLEEIAITFFLFCFLLTIILYFLTKIKKTKIKILSKINFIFLIKTVISFRIIFSFSKTILQYYLWQKNDIAQFLLPPYQSIKYFIFYSFYHFWLNTFLIVGFAVFFYCFLKMLKKFNENFFEKDEIELGFLTALIVGWPGIIIFIPITFLIAAIINIFSQIFLKEKFTLLGGSFILAGLITIFFTSWILRILKLNFLKI